MDIVLFDADCSLCRQLATFGERRAGERLRFVAWQVFVHTSEGSLALTNDQRNRPADVLRALVDGQLVEGDGVWRFLLERHPDLAALNWLATKVGLTNAATKGLTSGAALLRRLCGRCGRRRDGSA